MSANETDLEIKLAMFRQKSEELTKKEVVDELLSTIRALFDVYNQNQLLRQWITITNVKNSITPDNRPAGTRFNLIFNNSGDNNIENVLAMLQKDPLLCQGYSNVIYIKHDDSTHPSAIPTPVSKVKPPVKPPVQSPSNMETKASKAKPKMRTKEVKSDLPKFKLRLKPKLRLKVKASQV